MPGAGDEDDGGFRHLCCWEGRWVIARVVIVKLLIWLEEEW